MALNTTYTHQTDTSQFQNGRERAHYVYLIKRADGLIKVGVASNRRSEFGAFNGELSAPIFKLYHYPKKAPRTKEL